MGWSVTDRGELDHHATSANWTSGSFTPDGDSLLLLVIYTRATITGVSGQDDGSSWVQLWQDDNVPASGHYFEVWGCFTDSSPSSGTVTITKPYTWNCTATLLEIQESVNGIDVSGTVANAFGTRDIDAGYDVRTPELTLASFADSDNLTFTAHASAGDDSGITFEAAYTQSNQAGGTNNIIIPSWLDGEDNTINATVDSYENTIFWGVEIKQGSAGTTRPLPQRVLSGCFSGPLGGPL